MTRCCSIGNTMAVTRGGTRSADLRSGSLVRAEGHVESGTTHANATVAAFAPRIFTLRVAVRICVLEDGRITDSGTYNEPTGWPDIFARVHAVLVTSLGGQNSRELTSGV